MSLESVHFTDAANGWAVGRDGTLMHTTDAGETWKHLGLNETERIKRIKVDPRRTDATSGGST